MRARAVRVGHWLFFQAEYALDVLQFARLSLRDAVRARAARFARWLPWRQQARIALLEEALEMAFLRLDAAEREDKAHAAAITILVGRLL
jgi:hypothetical protein